MKITIYGRSHCRFCDLACDWFDQRGISYDYIKLDNPEEKRKFYESYAREGVKTVPQIIINGERLGGFTELVRSQFAKDVDTGNVQF